jgi:hypothetical protein
MPDQVRHDDDEMPDQVGHDDMNKSGMTIESRA